MTIGSLCSGIGGLELAAEALGFGPVLWHVEFDKHASTILARHWPGVPNLGDVKAAEWERVPRVDVVTAGYPCQPFSFAGRRGGTDDPRHLWPHIRCALRVLRPRLILLENVAGHLSLGFDRVLADLAADGFDARWTTLPASAVGAPHRRDRLFVVAHPVGQPVRNGRRDSCDQERERERAKHRNGNGFGLTTAGAVTLLGDHRLLPTPERSDGSGGRRSRAFTGTRPSGAKQALNLQTAVDRLLPTPGVSGGGQARNRTANRMNPDSAHHDGVTLADVAYEGDWGPFAAAIARWERVMGPAPVPTDGKRLSPDFVRWMQGYEPGWVDGIPRTGQLRCLGNAVVPQQALAAFASLLGIAPPERERERVGACCRHLGPRTPTEQDDTAAEART